MTPHFHVGDRVAQLYGPLVLRASRVVQVTAKQIITDDGKAWGARSGVAWGSGCVDRAYRIRRIAPGVQVAPGAWVVFERATGKRPKEGAAA